MVTPHLYSSASSPDNDLNDAPNLTTAFSIFSLTNSPKSPASGSEIFSAISGSFTTSLIISEKSETSLSISLTISSVFISVVVSEDAPCSAVSFWLSKSDEITSFLTNISPVTKALSISSLSLTKLSSL